MRITDGNHVEAMSSVDEMVSRGDLRTARNVVRKFKDTFPKAIYGCLKESSPALCRYVSVTYGGRGFKEKLDVFLKGSK